MKRIPKFIKGRLFKNHPPGTQEKNNSSNRKNHVGNGALFVNSGDVGGDIIINLPLDIVEKRQDTNNVESSKIERIIHIKAAIVGVIVALAFSVIFVTVFMCFKSNPDCFSDFCVAFGKFIDLLIRMSS